MEYNCGNHSSMHECCRGTEYTGHYPDEHNCCTHSSGNGISTFGAILVVIGCFLLTAFVISLFGDADEMSGGVILILFILITSVVGSIIASIFE